MVSSVFGGLWFLILVLHSTKVPQWLILFFRLVFCVSYFFWRYLFCFVSSLHFSSQFVFPASRKSLISSISFSTLKLPTTEHGTFVPIFSPKWFLIFGSICRNDSKVYSHIKTFRSERFFFVFHYCFFHFLRILWLYPSTSHLYFKPETCCYLLGFG